MLAAGIGLPHPGVDGYVLYLGDRPDAKIIARLTAAAPREREHGSVNRALPRGRIEILRNAIAPYGADHAFGDPTRQQIACNWQVIARRRRRLPEARSCSANPST